MAQSCNISYTISQREEVNDTIESLWGRNYTDDEIQTGIRNAFNGGQEIDTKVALDEVEGSNCLDFIDAITQSVCNLDHHSPEMLSGEAKHFRDVILGTFFDMSKPSNVTIQSEDNNNAGNTDENKKVELEKNLQDATMEIYGPINSGLSVDLQDSFSRELRKRLIYDPDNNLMHNLNRHQLNARIIRYKIEKFNSVLKYLKEQYPDDQRLQGITNLYDQGYLNSKSYQYVVDLFKKHLDSLDDLGATLNQELDEKIGQKYVQDQIRAYNQLVNNVILKDADLTEWFNAVFTSAYDNSNAKFQLFVAGRFSKYYNKIQDKLKNLIAENPNQTWAKEALGLLEKINNPHNGLLEVVNDFIKLNYFDDLIGVELNEYVSYNRKAYQRNNLSASIHDQKYEIRASHKHQNSGFETYDKENSESHTSTTVKRIIADIPIYHYDNVSQATGEYMTMNGLIQAWQALVQDILEGNIVFTNSSGKTEEVKIRLTELANSIGDNVIDHAEEILRILFDDKGVSHWSDKAINYMSGNIKLTEGHKNILYSFYQDVLNKNNPSSKISLELAQINDSSQYKGQYLPITSDITAVLYRNVSNTYLDCSLQGKTRSFGVRAKFTWDSDLFDLVEGCDFASKVRQHRLIGVEEDLTKYNYQVSTKNGITTLGITLPNTEDKIEFTYLSAHSTYGLFNTNDVVNLKEDSVKILNAAKDVDLDEFKKKLLNDSTEKDFDEDEQVLYDILKFIDTYLKTGFLTENGLNALKSYKENYSKFHTQKGVKVFTNNYLQHFVKLAMRAIDVDQIAMDASDENMTMAEYLKSGKSRYSALYNSEKNSNLSRIVSVEGNKVFFAPISTQDPALNEYVKYFVIAKGRSTKSTSLNKAGSTVSNYSVARLGSELNQRLAKQRALPVTSAAHSLLFVRNSNLLDTEPAIDSEITTLIGDVKAVRDMSTGELFQHSIFDKFYKSFIDKGKICFQPTVYSDKTQFLNYFASLKIFDDTSGRSIMDFTRDDVEEICLDKYKETFFEAHSVILDNIIAKINRLSGNPIGTIEQAREFLHGRLYDNSQSQVNKYLVTEGANLDSPEAKLGLKQLVDAYNALHPEDKIELELDKDYRVKTDIYGNKYCELNEIVEQYAFLAGNSVQAKKARIAYFAEQKRLFAENLKEYGVTLKLFDSKKEMADWVKRKATDDDPEKYVNYLLDIISNPALLSGTANRQAFVNKWVDQNTGELKIQDETGKLNPLLERFFYIEGLYSNNLRMSLTGTEANHPDKAKDTLYDIVRDGTKEEGGIKQYLAARESENPEAITGARNALIKTLQNHGITSIGQTNVDQFVNNFLASKSLNGLRTSVDPVIKEIYDKSIISIINTAEGTQFKRNVIVTATLQHPITGKIDGVASKVQAAVIYDTKAPVNNLRESDKIDAQDGSAQMSPIQVHLENSSLGDQKVGTNRKPIWDDQTDDCTSFLAKFAAFGHTNAMMVKSAQSTSGQYLMFKKMHHIRWNGTIDLTHSIQIRQNRQVKDQEAVNNWFNDVLLKDNNGNAQRLYYKNADDEVIQIVGFGKEGDAYYTIERYAGQDTKVFHYFDDEGNHYNQKFEGSHTIDSLFELHKALGGINNCTQNGKSSSEFNLKVLTNFVNNVGWKVNKEIKSSEDVVQPLKDKFIAYAFNSTAVKNGAKNINPASAWTDNSPLSTFSLNIKGLGIQLNADHDVTDSELTEFSQVVAACAAYGKRYSSINEIYYGLAESAFEASKEELTNINEFLSNTKDPALAKYKLYKIVSKLILKSKSNSDLDLTEHLKQEISKSFKIDKDGSSSELKVPFSDPSIYTQFISSITSVINSKSIKRKHPGSGYVMAPGYNVVQYYQIHDGKEYKRYMFDDVLALAKQDYRGKLINAITAWNRINGAADAKYIEFNGQKRFKIERAKIGQLKKIIQQHNIDLTSITGADETETNLIQRALQYNQLDTNDTHNFNVNLVKTYIATKQTSEQNRDSGWFMPTDNVLVTFGDGKTVSINLDSMNDYYAFKSGKTLLNLEKQYGAIASLKLDISKPVNLKPSLIRWQYVNDTGQTKFMTIYDHPIIKDGWSGKKHTQAEIQKVLDDLDKGYFEMDGKKYDIIPGSLENTEAEVVLGNMYKDIFDVGDDSLATVLAKGEDYFREKAKGKVVPQIPKGFYDFALTKNNGHHVLISLGNVNSNCGITEVPINRGDETVNDSGEIYFHDVKIGKYIDSDPNWTYIAGPNNSIGKVVDASGAEIDPSQYRLVGIENGDIKIQKRVNFVTRYSLEHVDYVNGVEQTQKYTLYKIADVETIKSALSNINPKTGTQLSDKDMTDNAFRQISKILKDIYGTDKFSDFMVNTQISHNLKGNKLDNVKTRQYLLGCLGDAFGSKFIKDKEGVREMTPKEIEKLGKFERHMLKIKDILAMDGDYLSAFNQETQRYHEELQPFHEQWVSFLNSLHFISSRIPAQSLQSFMPMVCVGWTSDTSNTAYVSYIQTYLQGSDYDIDKAYIMGQSFTDDGQYIGWSNLFSFKNFETLSASKTLPVPRGYVLKGADEKYDISSELTDVIAAQKAEDKASEIRAYAKLITKIDAQQGKYWHNMEGVDSARKILKKVQKHELYKIPYYLKEQAYKNVASANIFNNVHNIRNRDQAYSPITMRNLQDAAAHSPKGEKSKSLNMANPLTKYIMQNQNLVGKDVIGIAANGEKDWFNLTYYYHNLLRTGDDSDLFFLKMSHDYNRIQGRAQGHPVPTTIKHIPDLWNADGVVDKKALNSRLATKLKELFYTEEEFAHTDVNDKYVDQLISQLLSAATDNAKELILAKINAGTNLAKYHLHLIMMGFSLDDIMSFMTSPVVELVDKYSRSDLYGKRIATVNSALKLIQGQLKLSQYLIKPNNKMSYEERQAALEAEMEAVQAQAEIIQEAREQGYNFTTQSTEYKWVTDKLVEEETGVNMYAASKVKNFETFIQKYIQAHTTVITDESDDVLKLLSNYNLPITDNFNTNQFFNFVNSIIEDIKGAIAAADQEYSLNDFTADLQEFKTLSDEVNETSTLASVWLKLNQGVPQTDIELIKLMKKMNNSIQTRESKFGIKKLKESKKRTDLIVLTDADEAEKEEEINTTPKKVLVNQLLDIKALIDSTRTGYEGASAKEDLDAAISAGIGGLSKNYKTIKNIVTKIKANNPMLSYDEIVSILIDVVEADMFGNFDLYKYLSDANVTLVDHSYALKDQEPVTVRYSQYKDRDGNLLQGNLISYRELASRYYNLIKSNWNILDIMRRIPHYEKNLDLLNYTLQNRQLFTAKAKIIDTLIGLGELSYLTLTDKDYKKVIGYADRVLNTAFFFSIKEGIPLNTYINSSTNSKRKLPLLFNSKYELVEDSILHLDSLNGIDSLKHFVENEFLNFLKDQYGDNPLVKDLDIRSNRGKSILRTRLNLDDINSSLTNQQTFNRYLVGIKQLAQVEFARTINADGSATIYTLADMLALYNLAVNSNKLGGKYLTAIFKDSVLPGSVLYKYYQYLGTIDYDNVMNEVHPTKRDFLIAIAPIVYSKAAVDFRDESYVKLVDPVKGFQIWYKPKGSDRHIELNMADMLKLDKTLGPDEKFERLYDYFSNSLTLFPELHKRMVESNIFMSAIDNDLDEKIRLFEEYIQANKLAIYKDCR